MAKVEPYPGETEPEEIEGESLVRLRLITHNARLVDARKERGMTGEAMAAAAPLSREKLRHIETLKIVPTVDEMCRISCVLEKPIDYLFPEELMSAVEAGVFSRRKAELTRPAIISLTEAQRRHLLTYDGEGALIDQVSRTLLKEEVKVALATLKPRERQVLELRYGLNGGRCETLEEVGKELNIQRERTRQIQAKALRKLRHPRLSRGLKDYLD